jgi:hypothetical protein
MKFKVQRKLNLANIDKDIWPYETEDIGIEDADSFEEAQQMVDKLVAERIGYYKAKSDQYHKNKINNKVAKKPKPSESVPVTEPSSTNSDISNMPPEFNI